ncbi:MAG: DUF4105 domain-containing protein [Gemmatimonadaceae bacterium]
MSRLSVLAIALLLAGGARAGAQSRARVVPDPSAPKAKPRVRTVPPPRQQPKAKPKAAAPAKKRAVPVKPRVHVVAPPPVPSRSTAEPGSELAVTLITFGVGEEIWERFGHNAIWIHDGSKGTDVAYNWGLFDFEQPDFTRRFLTGDTKYWMGGEEALTMVSNYHSIGRTVTLQRLNLTPKQALLLRDFVQNNALEENKYYRYDYYRDNCSTRLRDALDVALGGGLRAETDTRKTALTYRSESMRLAEGDLPVQVGMDIALGRDADVPLTAWQSFFIPMRLRDELRHISVPRGDGTRVPLVTDEQVIAPASGSGQAVEANEAPDLSMPAAIAGGVLAFIVVLLRILARRSRAASWLLALLGMAWALLCGGLGVIILLAWFTTKHVFWAQNENVLLLSPLWIPLIILIPAALLGSRGVGKARGLVWLNVALGVGALALSLQPGGQDSEAIVALFLPVHVALAWALSLMLPPPEPKAVKKE